MAANPQSIRYSLVIPVFNEEAVLPVLLRRLDLLLPARRAGRGDLRRRRQQ